jgi:hypothetical protein
MPIRVARILEAPIRAHAAHIFCATGVLSRNSRILKNRPKMPSEGSERPSLAVLRVFHSMQMSAIYFGARCAHAAHVFAEYAARRVGSKELAEDAFLRAQNAFFRLFLQFSACEPMFCAVCGHLAHTAHVFSATHRGRKLRNLKTQPGPAP